MFFRVFGITCRKNIGDKDMTVEFKPKNEGCWCFGAPNVHVFELLKKDGVRKILGEVPLTNDPIDASQEQSLRLGKFIRDNKHSDLKDWPANADMYAEFFEQCGGFTTS